MHTSPDQSAIKGPGTLLGLGIILNFFFPKGGFYVGDIPLTWGYLFLLPTVPLGFLNLFHHGRISTPRLICFLACLPFCLVAALTIATNGAELPSFAVSLFVTFAFLPFAIFLCFDDYMTPERVDAALRFAARGFVYVAAWGIFAFIVAAIIRTPLDIPFITTGGGSDLNSFDRMNWRGAFFKLTSTFNNGNIYGACCLMMLPVISLFEPRWKALLVKMSLVLTLSRTAWIGLVAYEIGYAVIVRRNRGTMKTLIIVAAATGLILPVLALAGFTLDFIFDTSLGGRLHIFTDVGDILPFSIQKYDLLAEIVYPSVLGKFGYIGLIAFMMAMTAPLLCRHLDPSPLNRRDRSLLFSLLIYLLICWSDGAILFIPSMFFYWSLATCLVVPRSDQPFDVRPLTQTASA